jgi:hypothetical protein
LGNEVDGFAGFYPFSSPQVSSHTTQYTP